MKFWWNSMTGSIQSTRILKRKLKLTHLGRKIKLKLIIREGSKSKSLKPDRWYKTSNKAASMYNRLSKGWSQRHQDNRSQGTESNNWNQKLKLGLKQRQMYLSTMDLNLDEWNRKSAKRWNLLNKYMGPPNSNSLLTTRNDNSSSCLGRRIQVLIINL
jgi:hypothetical protein